MAARKVVRTLSSTGFSAPIIGAPPHAGLTAEVATVAAFGDKTKTKVAAPAPEYNDIVLTVLDEGGLNPPTAGAAAATWTITTVYGDGVEANEVTRSFSRTCAVSKVEPAVVEVDGNRRAAWTITLTPQGGDAPATEGMGAAGGET